MATPSFHLFPFLIRLLVHGASTFDSPPVFMETLLTSVRQSGLTITHLQVQRGIKLISPGENIPSNEEQRQSQQQESWSLHLSRFEINI